MTEKQSTETAYTQNRKSIKYYVNRFLQNNKAQLKGKTVIDFPAGNGVTTRIIKDLGAIPLAFDLFPEFFNVEGIICERANISEGLPVNDKTADVLICQEGIEHFTDQLRAIREFNRVLKPGGRLLVTTPNYSNLRSKLSYLLGETERFNSKLAPNELDSIWMSKQDISAEIFYGHIFLIGIQKLRTLARLSGFKIQQIYFTRAKSTSVLLFPFFYPFIFFSNWIAYRKSMNNKNGYDTKTKKETYGEIFKLGINPKILVDGHLMVEFIKVEELAAVAKNLKSGQEEFGLT